jgi:hypothetical protein
MNRGIHHRCTSTQDGQDQLKVLATEATIQETTITGVSTSSRIGGFQDRKTG